MTALTPQEYYDKIKNLRNPEEIKGICEELTASLFNESDKPKTRANKLTPYNKLINGIPNEELVEGQNAYIQAKADGSLWKRHLHFQFTGLAETKWNGEGGINTKTVVLDRLENRREVKVEQYLEIVSRLLLSDDPHELAVGLIGASGRRPVEILARGNFSLATELPAYLKPGYFVEFKGQAKKRDYDMPEEERTAYRIGVLVPAQVFLAQFKRFRQMPESKEIIQFLKTETKKGTDAEAINQAIDSRRGNSLRRVVTREFGSFLPARFGDTEINNKSLRAVYVRLITDRDCPKNVADLLWASRSVGHFIDNQKPDDNQLRHLLTTLGYSDYYADSAVPFIQAPQKPKAEKTVTVRATSEDCEKIKKLQETWGLPNQQATVSRLIELVVENEKLQNQLLDARAQQKDIEQMNQQPQQSQPAQPQAEDLQAMVKRMVAEALAEALHQPAPQTQAIQPAPQPATEPQPLPQQPKAKAEASDRDWESVPSEELKASKHKGAASEKVKRAFLAITRYNDAQSTNDTRWVVNNQALRQLSGCNGMLVADWMQSHNGAISDHNNKYGLGQYHNKRHGKSITDVIRW